MISNHKCTGELNVKIVVQLLTYELMCPETDLMPKEHLCYVNAASTCCWSFYILISIESTFKSSRNRLNSKL